MQSITLQNAEISRLNKTKNTFSDPWPRHNLSKQWWRIKFKGMSYLKGGKRVDRRRGLQGRPMRDPCWGKEGTKGGRHGLQGVKGSHGGQLGMVWIDIAIVTWNIGKIVMNKMKIGKIVMNMMKMKNHDEYDENRVWF